MTHEQLMIVNSIVDVFLIACLIKYIHLDYIKKHPRPLRVKVNPHGGPLPSNANGKGNWYDLSTTVDITMKQGEMQVIDLGLSIETPRGYTTYILPRSSTYKRHGIIMANSVGVIDTSYCGDNDRVGFLALAMRDTMIPAGTRIAQMTIMPSREIIFKPSILENEDRGGFGSTGE